MKASTIKYIALFNLFLGLSLLLSGWVRELSYYRFLEDTFYKWSLVLRGEIKPVQVKHAHAERVQLVYAGQDGREVPGSIQWKLTPYAKAPEARLFLVEVGEDPDGVFQGNPPLPMDYAVIFYQLHQLGANKVAVTSSLTWPPPVDPIEEDALTYEIANYNRAVIGLVMSPSARRVILPKALEPLVLQPEQISGSIGSLMGVGRVVDPPQLQSDKAIAITPMRVETEPDTDMTTDGRKLALFVRWGNYVLPTLPLVSALDALNVKVSDVKVKFGAWINLGGKRLLPIDEAGRITLQSDTGNGVIRVPATKLVPIQDAPHDVRLQKALAGSQAVLLGEGKTPVESLERLETGNALWDWDQSLDVTAAGVQTLLQGFAPGDALYLKQLGRWGQLIVLFDVLLLGTWALTFPGRWRKAVLILLPAALLLTGVVMAAFFHLWLPLTPSLIGMFLIILTAFLMDRKNSIQEESKAEEGSDSEVALCPVPPPTLMGNEASSECKKKEADSEKADYKDHGKTEAEGKKEQRRRKGKKD